jgi:hypothetical protein
VAAEDLSWRHRAAGVSIVIAGGDRGGEKEGGMRKGQGPAGVIRVDQASSASAFRELDDAFLQVSSRGFSVWFRLCGLADGD